MRKTINLPAASVVGSFDLLSGSVMSFAMVFLLNNGFTEEKVGYLGALANILAALSQPILSHWADKSKTKSIYFFMLLLLIPLIISLFGILSLRNPIIILSLFYIITLATIAILVPFHNSLIMYLMNNGYQVNFGSIRSAGSLAFAVTTSLVGLLVDYFGTDTIIYYSILGWLVYFSSVTFLHHRYAVPLATEEPLLNQPDQLETQLGLRFLSKYPLFKWLMLGAFFNFIAFNILNTFMYQIMENVGGGTREMGFVFSLAALVEIPSMNLYAKATKKISHGRAVKYSSVFFFIQIFLVTIANSVFGVFVGQSFQSLAFAVYIVGIVYYTNDLMEGVDKVKGQSFITMSQTIGSVIGSSVGGWIIRHYSIKYALMFGVFSALMGVIAFHKGLRDANK